MRTILLATLILFATFIQASAQTMPAPPPTTFPEPGTFCGLFKLCE